MKKILFLLFVTLSGVEGFSQDSTNTFDYNYRKGIIHYNKGVDSVNRHNVLGESEVHDTLLLRSGRKEFTEALPFLLKAYSINPKNEKLLTALQGVYFSLYEFRESDRYKSELEQLKKKK